MTGNKMLEVLYRGKSVGTLAEMPDKRIAFQYDNEWNNTGFSISPLSLPLRNEVFIPPRRSGDCFNGLFGVFAGSLPDAWGELLLDRYLGSIGIKKNDISILDRLAYVGSSGMGALEYYPAKSEDFRSGLTASDYDSIAVECEKILSSKSSDKLDELFALGGSSGGTRPKVLINMNGSDWIVKFPAGSDPVISGKREYDYSVCAKKCGIIMTQTELIKSSVCDGYFKTERFDRRNGEKIHSVSFAGLLETDYRVPSCDYETYFKLIRHLTKDNTSDIKQMYMVMCFNILAHNQDDHTKNFSFIYTEDMGWRLAPAYDLTYSDTYWGEQTTSVNGKGKDITKSDLIAVGKKAGLSDSFCDKTYDEINLRIGSLSKYLENNVRKKGRQVSFSDRLSEVMGGDL